MLENKIQEDFKAALKTKREFLVSTLRMLTAALFNKEKEKRYQIAKKMSEIDEKKLEKESQLTDEEILEVIASEIKKRKEAAELYEKGKRLELAEKERREIEILQKYLPEQLSKENIEKIAKEVINKIGAKGIRDMGKVMAELMPKVKGRAEGDVVSKIVKELLSL